MDVSFEPVASHDDPITTDEIPPDHAVTIKCNDLSQVYDIVTLKRIIRRAESELKDPVDPIFCLPYPPELLTAIKSHPIPIPSDVIEIEEKEDAKRRADQEAADARYAATLQGRPVQENLEGRPDELLRLFVRFDDVFGIERFIDRYTVSFQDFLIFRYAVQYNRLGLLDLLLTRYSQEVTPQLIADLIQSLNVGTDLAYKIIVTLHTHIPDLVRENFETLALMAVEAESKMVLSFLVRHGFVPSANWVTENVLKCIQNEQFSILYYMLDRGWPFNVDEVCVIALTLLSERPQTLQRIFDACYKN